MASPATTTTTTTATSSNGKSKKLDACPYAVALMGNSSSSNSSDSSYSSDNHNHDGSFHSDNNEDLNLVEVTRQKCPAFADNACPFKGAAASPAAVKQALRKIPASHYQLKPFVQVMQGLHQTAINSPNNNSKAFVLPGGCPVPPDIKGRISFRDVMENMSFSAMMARLARDLETNKKEETEYYYEDGSSAELRPMPTTTSSSSSSSNTTTTTATATTTPPQSLSVSLKEGTAVSHQAAEDVHFVKNFIQGRIDRRLYAKLVLSLYHVYQVLEQALQDQAPTHFPSCHFPHQLARTPALAHDVEFWHGHDSTNLEKPSPATRDYMKRLDQLARHNPLLLLAHSYTRYLGDLSGGKVLARVARRALHLSKSSNDGLAFYDFEHIASAKRFKDQYRQALDDLPLSPEQVKALVAEANIAFLLNMRIFEELDVYSNIPGATVRPVSEVLALVEEETQQEQPKQQLQPQDQCPFLVAQKNTATTTTTTTTTTGASSPTTSTTSTTPTTVKMGKRCPWPFVVLHDPAQFGRDWQTWLLLGVLLCAAWSQIAPTM